MPKPLKPRRQQPRFDPQRGPGRPEMVDLVDAAWLLKTLGLMLALGLLCACLSLWAYHHYQKTHATPAPPHPTRFS